MLLLASSLGFYVYYALELHEIKQEMSETLKTLPDEKLEIIILPQATYLEAIVEEGEIKVDNKMYDVARVSLRNGFAIVSCLHDTKEDNLFLLLGEIIAKPLGSDHQVPANFVAFLTLIFVSTSAIFAFARPCSEIEKIQHYQPYFLAISLEKTGPPPRG